MVLNLILNTKQKEKWNIIDHTKRLNKESGILKYHVGTDTLEKFIENNEEYRSETNDVGKYIKEE